MVEENIAWDLTPLYKSQKDPKINTVIQELEQEADYFVKEYKCKIDTHNFTAKDLLKLFERQEAFEAELDELMTYAHILYDANMTIPESEELKNKSIQFGTEISQKLTFLELETAKFVSNHQDLTQEPLLNNYKHYLEKINRKVPHLLSELEEQLILEKDQFGVIQWSQLQGKWLGTRKFEVIVEGVPKILSYNEANSLLSHSDRDTRLSAIESIYSTLGKDEYIFSTSLRNICGDWMKTVERRKYDNALHSSLIINDSSEKIINSLMQSVEENVEVYQRYMHLKAKLLKLPKLNYADVLAPLLEAPKKRYSWQETKDLILEAYTKFDEEFARYVKDMFDKDHIDASTRDGKRNGAYCASWYKGKSAFILMNYTGQLREISTLAHELGHAIHDYLAIEAQTYFNVHPGYTVAECASIFGELLLTDLLLEKSDSDVLKKTILANLLDEAGMAVFQVSSRYWFEEALYDAINRKEYLDGPTIYKYWLAGRDKVYGDSVTFSDSLKWEWTMKPHYFRIGLRFYNYPYVYAQLFVYALYQKYKVEGKSFVPKFKKLLTAGGSLSPEDLGKIVGLDITSSDFWKLGIKQYEDFVNQLEKLIE